jgi:tRNA 5-methylaminomethyl-2-thiouridine biosynthesis bifunctional protein
MSIPSGPPPAARAARISLPPFPLRVSEAVIDWHEGTPLSRAFADVYFSLAGGSAETEHVFIDGNRLRERFAAPDLQDFTIAETGFGTGLNFLVAAQAFLQLAPAQARLHFLSVEKFPLSSQDLERAHAHWPGLSLLAQELRQAMPPACSGCHRRELAGGRIRLTLLLGDAEALLPRVDARVDAWFLDGFAPAKNSDLWQDGVLAQVRRLAAPGATFATFTAAGQVRRALSDAGFAVEKCAGFGRKRDMLRGELPVTGSSISPASSSSRHVAVIGGGLAGCAAARAFAERGWQVTLFERNATLASETSGNLAGAVYPKFSAHETAQNRWYRDSYLYALARLPQVLGAPDGERWSRCGLLQTGDAGTLAGNIADWPGQQGNAGTGVAGAEDAPRWPAEVLARVTAATASALAGVTIEQPALWFPGAAWVHPPALCNALVAHAGIRVRCGEQAQVSAGDDAGIRVNGEHVDALVIANALQARELAVSAALPLRPVRGQVTHVAATPASQALRCIVCHEGYLTPARHGSHCVGATFAPRDRDASVRDSDHWENLQALAAACPALFAALGGDAAHIEGGRTGFRAQTPDYLPVIGAVAALSDDGNGIRRVPDVYVLAGLGAKGIAFSLLGAEIIAARANGEPLPVDSEVAEALDPARFLLRALHKNGKTQQKTGKTTRDSNA